MREKELSEQKEKLLQQVVGEVDGKLASGRLRVAEKQSASLSHNAHLLKQQVSKLKSTVYKLEKELAASERRHAKAVAEVEVSKDLLELNRKKLQEQRKSFNYIYVFLGFGRYEFAIDKTIMEAKQSAESEKSSIHARMLESTKAQEELSIRKKGRLSILCHTPYAC